MNNSDNQHVRETAYSCRTHYNIYKDNKLETACGEKDNPTRIQLRPKSGQWPTLDFEMPRQRYELGKVEQLMESAYRRGQTDKMAEIAGLFKTIIGL
jgi:hypothetical protein